MTGNIIKAVKIKEIIRSGSSLPVITEDESGNEFIVKLKGIGDGIITNITEYISTCIGYNIELPVLRPYIINIDENTSVHIKSDEFEELIQRSYGLNICHIFYRNAFPYEKTGKIIDKEITDKIFLFDCFLLNVDRRKLHSDVISAGDETFATDFGSSFLIRGIVNDINFYNDESIIKQIKRSPFYNENIPEDTLSYMFEKLMRTDISSIISELPDEWLNDINENTDTLKKQMHQRLKYYINNKNLFLEALERMKELEIESEEEIKKRQQENRKKFESKILFKNRKQ